MIVVNVKLSFKFQVSIIFILYSSSVDNRINLCLQELSFYFIFQLGPFADFSFSSWSFYYFVDVRRSHLRKLLLFVQPVQPKKHSYSNQLLEGYMIYDYESLNLNPQYLHDYYLLHKTENSRSFSNFSIDCRVQKRRRV